MSNKFTLNSHLILAILLSDNTDDSEYFCHKFKVSNEMKNKITFLSNFLNKYYLDKNDFKKDLVKNIYFFGKKNLTELYTLIYFSNEKMNIDEYFKNVKKIESISIPKFPYDGNFLKKRGYKEGKEIGLTLNKLELEWIQNGFYLNNDDLKNIIKKN